MMDKSGNNNSSSQHKGKNKKPADPRTLFVKFFPPSAFITRQHLSDHFSNYGPVNRCSVIRQSTKGNISRQQTATEDGNEAAAPINLDRGSKGYGFVRFVHEDDAKSAADANLKKRSKKNGAGEVMIVEGVQYKLHAERAVDADNNNNNASTPAASAPTPTPKATTKSTNTSPKEVTPSKQHTKTPPNENTTDDAYKVESKRKRTSRVIIRNLSFYAEKKHVKSAMEINFGPVSAVDLPLVPDLPSKSNTTAVAHEKKNAVPRHRGFAFVTFTNANAAKQAVEKGSEITIKNRKVAIDFSVSKMEHQKMMKDKKDNGKSGGVEESDSEEESDGEEDSEGSDGSGGDNSDSDSDEDDDSDSETEEENEEEATSEAKDDDESDENKETPEFDQSESSRTLFLRNIAFDATRHDVFELFRKFGRVEAIHLVKDRETAVFKGTAFVRFEKDAGCFKAMEASGTSDEVEGESSQFISSKNRAMGLGQDGTMSGLSLKGRHIFVDLAVDRTTASSLAVQRDEDGKPIKKMVGKDKRNLYLKNEGRVSSAADGGIAKDAGAKHGGTWEDLPPSDRARRERAFAERSTKLRSPLFFINPNRLSIRNLAKNINEAELKKLVFDALKTGLEQGLATPADAVSHWRAGGELPHSEVMRRATDANLVTPPLDGKNMKESVPSVFVDRDVSGDKKMKDAPSRGFAFAEFTHHSHAMAVLRQLNNNPVYSAEFAAGGKHVSEMGKRGGNKKTKKGGKVDPETGAEFLNEDGKVCVPRLIVEFTVENKIKAREQAEKIAQKKANKIKQKIEKKEKQLAEKKSSDKNKKEKEKKKGRGALQREKKRLRKESGNDDEGDNTKKNDEAASKKQKLDGATKTADKSKEKTHKMQKPQKKRKADPDAQDEIALEDMIRSYKTTFSKGSAGAGKDAPSEDNKETTEPKEKSRDSVAKKRWFE